MMKHILPLLLVLFGFISITHSQTLIGEGLSGQELWDYVVENYKTSSTLGYNTCRDIMYSEIDIKEGNQLTGVYSGYTITLDLTQDPSSNAYAQGINCEHTFPQSMGAGDEPMKSDMHHLRPCKENVNTSRANKPFNDIIDYITNTWYWLTYQTNNIPTNILTMPTSSFILIYLFVA